MKGRTSLPKEDCTPWVVKNDVCRYIDISYTEVKSRPLYRIFNASNILGAIAFLLLIIFIPAAVEGEMYIAAVVLMVIMAVCVHLSIKEDGKRK